MPGFTCCVPGCFNNNKRERHLKYYIFPKDPRERKIWINNIGRSGTSRYSLFSPTTGHRVCSEHFEGGYKTYMIKRPTVFPLKLGPTPAKRRAIVKTEESAPELNHLDVQRNPEELMAQETSALGDDHQYSLPDSKEHILRRHTEKSQSIEEMMDKIKHLEEQLSDSNEQIKKLQKELTSSQRDVLKWKRKYHMLNIQNESLKKELASMPLSMEALKGQKRALQFYTGFESHEEFSVLLDFLSPDFKYLQLCGSKQKNPEEPGKGRNYSLKPSDQLLLVLMRLRVGLLVEDLAYRFGIHHTTVSRICRTFFDLMFRRFRDIPVWPSRLVVKENLPECFRQSYPHTRVILDCTEMFIETPSHFTLQSETFSSYKGHNTAKGLLGIAPNGFVSFVSDLVPGRMSDKEVTEKSGLIDLLEEGDAVMADRGFLIDEYLAQKSIKLNMPPFMSGKTQLSPKEEEETRGIASVRIHVERVIERVKNFRILKFTFPNSMASDLNKVWVICCYLVNFTTDPIAADK